MRTVTFKSLLNAVAYGMDTVPADVSAVDLAKHVEALNLALRHGWAWPDLGWPELRKTEELAPSSGMISWSAASLMLGTVHDVWAQNPDTVINPTAVTWRWNSQGTGLYITESLSTVWVSYTPQTPEWTQVAYEADTDYPAGTVVYEETIGECYEAIAATASAAVTDSSKWRKLDVPWIFRLAAVRGAVALLRGSTGERGEEQILQESMGEVLAREWRQFSRSAGQHQRVPFNTAY